MSLICIDETSTTQVCLSLNFMKQQRRKIKDSVYVSFPYFRHHILDQETRTSKLRSKNGWWCDGMYLEFGMVDHLITIEIQLVYDAALYSTCGGSWIAIWPCISSVLSHFTNKVLPANHLCNKNRNFLSFFYLLSHSARSINGVMK